MPASSRLLVFGELNEQAAELVEELRKQNKVVVPKSLEEGLKALTREQFCGVLLTGEDHGWSGSLLESGGILEQVPDGVVLLDPDLRILWSNSRLLELTGRNRLLDLAFTMHLGRQRSWVPIFVRSTQRWALVNRPKARCVLVRSRTSKCTPSRSSRRAATFPDF